LGSKVYIEILNDIQKYISENGLQPGDKLPSERVLSDQLNVGRSSVREAFRSLEVLGLIETRRGEGTFLSDVSEHQLVELLSSFILNGTRAKNDIIELKCLLEKCALQLLKSKIDYSEINEIISNGIKIINSHKNSFDAHTMMFREIFLKVNNVLLLKIWILLSEYLRMSYDNFIETNILEYEKFINTLKKEGNEILIAYDELVKTV
jgi:DNA-binding FadR family transcriptional regulator